MSRRDDLAAQVAKNLQHNAALGRLYKVAQPEPTSAAAIRAELAQAAAHAGPAAQLIATAAQCDTFIVRLHGLARLTQRLRQALAEEGDE